MDFDNVQTRVADPGSVGIMLVSNSGKKVAEFKKFFDKFQEWGF